MSSACRDGRWRVTVGAGESWHAVVRATLGRGISGLENLILIPGAVGAAPVQNIGAYGRELADVVDVVTVFDRRRGQFETLSREQCGFGYRDSSFKRQPQRIIVRVSMILGDRGTMTDYPDVRAELQRMGVATGPNTVAEAVVRVRRRKLPDPDRVGNVGSFFKNPFLSSRQYDALRGRLDIAGHPLGDSVKVPAARLIDAAGWKGVAKTRFRCGPGSHSCWSTTAAQPARKSWTLRCGFAMTCWPNTASRWTSSLQCSVWINARPSLAEPKCAGQWSPE